MFKAKTTEGINRENLYFGKRLRRAKAERVFNTMEFISLHNRAVAMEMAWELFIREYGKPLEGK